MNFIKNVLFVAGVCAALFAGADTLTFTSGLKLVGTVTGVDGKMVSFKSDDLGDIKVDSAKLVEMKTEKTNTLLYKDDSKEEAVISIVDGNWMANDKPLDLASVKAVNPKEETWHGSVNISATAARGNTVSEKASFLFNLNRRWEQDRVNLNAAYYYAQSGSNKENKQKTEDKVTLSAQEDHFWSKKLYNYVNGKFEHDNIQNLDYRYRIGAGLGCQWLDGDQFDYAGKITFSQEAGVEYTKERYAETQGGDDNYPAFRYAHHFKWIPIWVPSVNIFHNLEYHPDTTDWVEQYVINTDVGFTTVVYAGWDLLVKAEWDYDSAPAENAKHSDIRYLLGLGYKW